MAEDYDTKIRIGMEADLAGGVQTEKQFDKLKQKAREFGKDAGSSSNSASAALGRVTSAVGKLRSVLTGLGVAGALAGLIASIKSIAESLREADKEAEKFAKAKKAAAQEKEVSDLADAYAKLTKAIQASSAANEHENAMIAKKVAAERELEDARAEAAKQRELDAIDPNDPTANEQRAAVEAKYARAAGIRAAARGREDIVYRRQELNSQADQLAKGAAADRESAGVDDRKIAELEKMRNEALTRATTENKEDATGFWSSLGHNITSIATGRWGRVGDARTDEGNALRAEAQAEADTYQRQIEQIKKSRDQKLQSAKDAETAASRKREEADIEGSRLEAADIRRSTSDASGTAARDKAEKALGDRRAKIEADEQTYERAVREKDSVDRQIEQAKAQLAVVQEQKAQNGLAMARAGDAYDMAVANGRPAREQRAAFDERQRAIREAQNAGHAFDRVEAELVATIKNLTERQNSLARTLSTFKKQSKADNSEYAGD